MDLPLTDEQVALLLAELDRIIENDRYPLSARIRALREIRAVAKPYPERPPMPPPPRQYEPPSRGPLQETQVKLYRGPLTTLGNAATAKVRLIVWCRECQHRVEPDPAEHAARYGAELPVRARVKWLKCSQCGSRNIDFVLTGARR